MTVHPEMHRYWSFPLYDLREVRHPPSEHLKRSYLMVGVSDVHAGGGAAISFPRAQKLVIEGQKVLVLFMYKSQMYIYNINIYMVYLYH